MGMILCACGNSIDLSLDPNPHTHYLISAVDYNDFLEHLSDDLSARELGTEWLKFLSLKRKYVYRCPHCGRLLLYESHDQKYATFYVLDDSKAPSPPTKDKIM